MHDRCPNCANAHPGTEIYQCPECNRFQCDYAFPLLDLTIKGCGHAMTNCQYCDAGRRYVRPAPVATITDYSDR
jgi:hypothetical protein